ncbi:hypothetical protein AMS68_005915 [Peltaster fructicola]|uniref:Uncharacterized protein n=1 Tax=Peltaster fructicola TaxID=286661 RepID=A0A6H0Y0M8_9PEZI|nr:hypothetical protein AMS68_005915 [Peltaster fructicola]
MRDYYGVGAEQRSHVSTARGNVAVTRHSSNTGLPVANAIVTSTEHRIWVPPTYLSQEQRAFNSQLTTQALPAHTSRAHRSLHASTDQRYGGPRLVATSSIAHGPFPSPRGPPGMSNLFPVISSRHQAPTQEGGGEKKKGKGSAAYSKIFEDAPSVRIALPEMVIGAYELLAYFPNHTQWPAAIIRLICNEWSTDNISAAQLFARGHQSGDEHHRRAGAVRHQVLQGGREFFRLANFTRQRYPSLMHHRELADASLWRPRTNITALDNARLVTLAQGVVNAPLGQDRGLVAQAIEIAVRDARLDWYVTDIPSVVQQYGLQLPPEAANIARWDINARARFHTRLTAAGGIRPRIDTL